MGKSKKNDMHKRKHEYREHKHYKYSETDIMKREHKLDVFYIFYKYKREFNKFLKGKECSLKDLDDFWRFLTKYEGMYMKYSSKNRSWNRLKLLNFTLKKDTQHLYHMLPSLDRIGEKIPYECFEFFIYVLLLYMDFKQKEKMSKLKKLRNTQRQLPVFHYKEEIIKCIQENSVVLIAGDTGCGKSTQIPQFIYKAGYKKIVCTQPRRIACISLAKRVAYETLTNFNSTVGYQIRFEKTKKKDTNIVYITEGLLLRQASDEETLTSYDVIILDEVHERHLHGDILVGVMKCLHYKRRNLKLILMSATINIKLFADYFSTESIKIIEVPGRLYPIDIIYKPIIKDKFDKHTFKFDCSPYLQIMQLIDSKYTRAERGDLLIFLSGIADIITLSEAVTEYSKEKESWIVLQLHSSLSLAEQNKVFDYPPEGVRKCIITTNIAETSVTIDGIRFVVDSGKANRMSYNMFGGIHTLSEQFISQDSAKQRSGRAGRTGPGVCFRLYSEEEFNQFEPYTVAEIHLVPLESLVLQMVSLGLKDIYNFPFLETPNSETIKDAIEKLRFHGALYEDRNLQLTPVGEALGRLPVDLAIGKMLISSTVFGNITSILCLAAAISVQSPYTNRAYRDLECQNERKEFESNHGDPITLLNLFKAWLTLKQNLRAYSSYINYKTESTKYWAKKQGLEEQRFYEIVKLMHQFKNILQSSNLLEKCESAEASNSERAIRHGELKNLKRLRYDLNMEMKYCFKKRMKHATNYKDDEKYLENTDIRDVEFRITNDYDTLQHLVSQTCVNSYTNIIILKLVLCSGLYPQIAVGDEYNYCKPPSEQLFHTRNKNFVFLHPMSHFGNHPDTLHLREDDIEVPPAGYFSKFPLSSKHELLIYQSILETTKVYLINTIRMPALQTLLLFSKKIQTNEIITRIACDEFLLFELPYVGEGKTLLLNAAKIRKLWNFFLNAKLEGKDIEGMDLMSQDLINDLVQFMLTKATYTVKRLLKADLKTIFTSCQVREMTSILNKNPFDKEYVVSEDLQFGGFKVTENITYACIVEEEWSLNLLEQLQNTALICPKCNSEIYGSFLNKLQHEEFCTNVVETGVSPKNLIMSKKINQKDVRKFFCSACQKTLHITPLESLQHKKKCNLNITEQYDL